VDERIVELETRLAFQEESINSLNQLLLDQQRSIEHLQREMQILRERQKAMTPSPLDGDAPELPPPHY
jgi:SlyX protein